MGPSCEVSGNLDYIPNVSPNILKDPTFRMELLLDRITTCTRSSIPLAVGMLGSYAFELAKLGVKVKM